MLWRSKFSVSPVYHNWVMWWATAAQQLTLLAVVRNRPLCQAPPPWRYTAVSRWRHIQNIKCLWNLVINTLSDVKTTGKYWLNFVVLTSRDKNKNCVVTWYGAPDLPRGVSSRGWPHDLRSARRPLTPLGRSGGPYPVTTQFYYHLTALLDIDVFKSGKKTSTTRKHIHNESANLIDSWNVAFNTNDWWNFP